jgi:hypothetical protein
MTVVALVGVLAGLGPAVPVSAGPPEFTVELSIDPTSGPAGSTISITGRCLWGATPGTSMSLIMYVVPGQGIPPTYTSPPLLPVQVNGDVVGELTVPDHFPRGDYSLVAECAVDDQVLPVDATATFFVTEGGTVATELPTTTDPTTGAATDPGRRAGPRYTG